MVNGIARIGHVKFRDVAKYFDRSSSLIRFLYRRQKRNYYLFAPRSIQIDVLFYHIDAFFE